VSWVPVCNFSTQRQRQKDHKFQPGIHREKLSSKREREGRKEGGREGREEGKERKGNWLDFSISHAIIITEKDFF
jgi:hypothetical protein